MHSLEVIVNVLNKILWDYLLIILLCGIGIYYTVKLKCIQILRFKTGILMLFRGVSLSGEKAGKAGMSSFQAIATAVAGQVGTGNLAGPATAIMAGGPGAIFWMWVSSFLGMSTIYAEAILAQKYKTTDRNGQAVGGPAYYIEKGLNCKWLAAIFAVLNILALGLVGNMVQSNSIANAFHLSFGISNWVVGLAIAILVGLVVIGGLHYIAALNEKLVPLKASVYIIGAVLILVINYDYIFPALHLIFVAAFNPQAALGGAVGVSIQQAARFGIARGLFSNEAGMGSTPHAHAVAKVKNPEDQALIAMTGVFTVCVIVTLTGLAIISTGLKMLNLNGLPISEFLNFMGKNGTGIAVTQYAYELIFGYWGGVFISISLMFFAFSTIIGWYYYAETNVRYLFGSMRALRIFQFLMVFALFASSVFRVDLIWNMADTFNGLMVIPNVIALAILSPIVIQYTRQHVYQQHDAAQE
ncbi:MAG: sodium:alanine symporter family protein [Yokenella regensburgei]|jgi:AGCS family alanine or glycine:cation symporter|uniref:AGCS family alanine or glycine:cation symporter n=1 Tax=Yokenella regensburgei TaxID=158877 RepID=A0AB38G1Z8_9ENTR|nr:sodium:alanine symporter family protein [Yokenella regensburgei]EHM45446.1 amino acid carrier protein [Yokenella regensburgei ATCC 43003]KAF1367434.1 AGCS family alanine or glycine:cation symporter [Yokenella regensburgei]KFD21787.1 Na(+)-linked D-alanine glycine permease [Yokenella regensburgei ATCC 49455]MDQ4428438.1 sodium:alanine symporter family protein [Yokenella regensburgei]MDR3105417.1 sodium:alanine symporter family protein [Yokenella regensburgei]